MMTNQKLEGCALVRKAILKAIAEDNGSKFYLVEGFYIFSPCLLREPTNALLAIFFTLNHLIIIIITTPKSLRLLHLGSGGEEGDEPRGDPHGGHVVEGGREPLQDVEGEEDEHGQEERVVVEDGEGGRLRLGNLVLLPEDALVLLLAGDLLVVRELLAHLLQNKSGLKAAQRSVKRPILKIPKHDIKWREVAWPSIARIFPKYIP